MTELNRTILITCGVNALILISALFRNQWFIGLFAAIFLEFIFGLILCAVKDVRRIGQGLLITSGISLIIGFTVCTANFRIQ